MLSPISNVRGKQAAFIAVAVQVVLALVRIKTHIIGMVLCVHTDTILTAVTIGCIGVGIAVSSQRIPVFENPTASVVKTQGVDDGIKLTLERRCF